MADTQIQPGSVVTLNSGGPSLTVGSTTTTGDKPSATCYYFAEGNPLLQMATLPLAALTLAPTT